MNNFGEKVSFIWSVADLLRGPYRPNRAAGAPFYNTSRYTDVLRATIEGSVDFKEAYDLTALGGGAFQEYAQRLGFGL